MKWSYLYPILFVTGILFALMIVNVVTQDLIIEDLDLPTVEYLSAPRPDRLINLGTTSLDMSMVDGVQQISFPRAGREDHDWIVRVWYEDGRYFDIERGTEQQAYELLVYITLIAGI